MARWRTAWSWAQAMVRHLPREAVIGLGALALLLTTIGALALGHPAPTHTVTVVLTAPTASATARPTDTVTASSTATATTVPVPAPTAVPIPCTDAGCNPWGYTFAGGDLIYDPPGDFCAYFACIPSFWSSTSGYVMECQDSRFSHSGGVQGSCSYHGGNWRPLYSPTTGQLGQPAPTATAVPIVPTATIIQPTSPVGSPTASAAICSGAQGSATWALAPCPQVAGQAGTLTVSAPGHGGAALSIVLDFGCASCAFVYQQFSLDASGYVAVSYTVPIGAAHSTTPISGYVNIAGGPTLSINAAPVQ